MPATLLGIIARSAFVTRLPALLHWTHETAGVNSPTPRGRTSVAVTLVLSFLHSAHLRFLLAKQTLLSATARFFCARPV